MSLIAGHLLDVNAKGGVSEEQAANMTRIIADAVELLPKLTTGIDVNVLFNDIRGFEVHLCWLCHCLAPCSVSIYARNRSCIALLVAVYAVPHWADTP